MTDQGRREHYGEFYGLRPVPRIGLPLLMVYGNCQAEALRITISGTSSPGETVADSLRIPPVHELTEEDLPHLQRWLPQIDVLVAQPVHDGYRGLPLGTQEIAAQLSAEARLVRIPSIRYAGLFPYQDLVRGEGLGDPPLVPYHDLRWLAEAAGLPGGPDTLSAAERRTAYATIAADSIAELARREQQAGAIPISDVVDEAGEDAGWTINHPGNKVLLALAGRVRSEVGLAGAPGDPGRVLLRSVRTPLLPEVVQALDLEDATPRADWLVDGTTMTEEEVRAVHDTWYAEHPDVLARGVEIRAQRLALLGWAV